MSKLPPSLHEWSLFIALRALFLLTWVAPSSLFGVAVLFANLMVSDASAWIAVGVLVGGFALAMVVTFSAASLLPKARDAAFRLKGERLVVAARGDDRAPFVAIHSFSDDASWRVVHSNSGLTPQAVHWYAAMGGREKVDATGYHTQVGNRNKYTLNLIAQAQEAAEHMGRTVIVGNARLAALDVPVIRLVVDDEQWRNIAALTMDAARAILLFPGNSGGLAWELGLIRRLGLHTKTIILMRPAAYGFALHGRGPDVSREGWTRLQSELPALQLPDYDPMGLVYVPAADFSIGHGVSLHGGDKPRILGQAIGQLLSAITGTSKPLATLLQGVSKAGAQVAALNYVDETVAGPRQEGSEPSTR